MTVEKLEKAKHILMTIESSERNIKFFERICEAGEGEIVICTKEKLSGGHQNVDSIYLSREVLEAIKAAYLGYYGSIIEKCQKEFEAL